MDGVDLAIIATVKNQIEMYKRLREYANLDIIAISANMEIMVDNYLEQCKAGYHSPLVM